MIEKYLHSPSNERIEKYNKEEALIKQTLGDLIIAIEHIGSTSIPGLSAKPIIDMMVLIESITDTKNITESLEKIGYIYKPEMSSAERIFLRKGEPVQYHLSISESKYPYWNRQILFRDYLRNHPESKEEYQKIKEEAIKNLSEDELKDISKSKDYSLKKGPFIQKILQLAEAELLK
jgi:GrpB-like predicted nucleotidyltransferase (UPF0157 family)